MQFADVACAIKFSWQPPLVTRHWTLCILYTTLSHSSCLWYTAYVQKPTFYSQSFYENDFLGWSLRNRMHKSHKDLSFRSFVAPLSKVCYTIDRQEIRATIKQRICDKRSNCYNILSFVIFIIGNPRIISTILSRNDRKWHESLLRGIVLWYAVTRAFLK